MTRRTKWSVAIGAALILAVTAALFVIPALTEYTCEDDFPAPVIAAGHQPSLALSCWDRITFRGREYAGVCLPFDDRLLGKALREDLDGPRLRRGSVTDVIAIEGVSVTQALVLKVRSGTRHICTDRSEFVVFASELSDERFDEIDCYARGAAARKPCDLG